MSTPREGIEHIDVSTHGYLLEGTWEALGKRLEQTIQDELGVHLTANPDALCLVQDSIGVDDARFIRSFQSLKATGGTHTHKVIIIAARGMTSEAQNALLKVVEEPTPGTYFFVVMPKRDLVLPTLQSRLRFITTLKEQEVTATAEKFLSASPAERLVLVETIIKEKDKASAHTLLDAVLQVLYQRDGVRAGSTVFEELISAQRRLGRRGASLKLLLEHIALILPHRTQ